MTEQDSQSSQASAASEEGPISERHTVMSGASIIEVFTHLAYRKWLIAKITGIPILVGLIACFLLQVRYSAVTKIMPPQQTQSSTYMLMNQLASSNAGSLASMAGGGLSLKSPNDIYIGLLDSRPVADAIIQKFDLTKLYHSRDMTTARKELAANTTISSETSGFIAISVTDGDKKRAAAMANAYTDELRALTKTLAVTEASRRRLFYEEQLKQSKEALIAAALAFQQVQQQKGLVQLDAQARAMIEGLATLRAQVVAKQVEVQALRSYSTEQNSNVQLAETELAALQAEETRLGQRNHSPGIDGMGLENVPSAGLEYLRAEHELQYQQSLYDMLMKQYDAARLDESKEATVIQVVEPAIPPDEKASPHRASILLASAMIGFMLACSIVVAIEFVRRDANFARSLIELKSAVLSNQS